MKEFGSDFHFLNNYEGGTSIYKVYPEATFVANGRQAINLLIKNYGWIRIWIPAYFCYEIIDSIKNTNIEVVLYDDYPFANDIELIKSLPYKKGDVLLRINFFGLRGYRSNKDLKVPVIEDHTHDLLGEWTQQSDADWCIASLRKTLPIAEGGMIWSPKGHQIKTSLYPTSRNAAVSERRWYAMIEKASYLKGSNVNKNLFRNYFLQTEEEFDMLRVSEIDPFGQAYLKNFDIQTWKKQKNKNWKLLNNNLKCPLFEVLIPENEKCNPFSYTILFKNSDTRNRYRKALIENYVYPAILWQVPESSDEDIRNFSERMLSIHCDGRYVEEDIEQLITILGKVAQNVQNYKI